MAHLFRRFNLGMVLASATAAALAGGCALAPNHLEGQPTPSAIVDMNLHSFSPKTVTIQSGQAVLWRNSSITWHTVTADASKAEKAEDVLLPAGAESFDSGKVHSGSSFEKVFTVPGTYRYFCEPHESAGMIGEIIVRPLTP